MRCAQTALADEWTFPRLVPIHMTSCSTLDTTIHACPEVIHEYMSCTCLRLIAARGCQDCCAPYQPHLIGKKTSLRKGNKDANS